MLFRSEVSSEDMLIIESSIKELKKLLYAGGASGQLDQKLSEGGFDGRKGN